jgi:hypothetical protein
MQTIDANVEQSNPTSLLWFFLRKGGRVMDVEKGIKRKFYTGVRNVKLREKIDKTGKKWENSYSTKYLH